MHKHAIGGTALLSLLLPCLQVSHWFDRKVASNPEQRTAVQNIVAGSSGRLPFIIWGPPGTGKTSTLVEAAAQVIKMLHDRQRACI